MVQLVNAIMAAHEVGKAQKEKNFSQEEERQLYKSVLHVLQDPMTGNGLCATTFWKRIMKHYQENRPTTCGERPTGSLETKWGLIKHVVSKFYSIYKSVLSLNQSGTSLEDVLDRFLNLYNKVHHLKNQPFFFVHY